MSTPLEVYQFFVGPVSCHAWNKDRTQIAVSPNNNEIHIYKRTRVDGQWERSSVLIEHDQLVTSLDWAPVTNRIVSCSQDRNAYVWQLDETTDTWKPTLVILRINRAATFVRWSPLENKFAVASGARAVAICYYETENDWWVSKHIRRPIRSTILSVAWHPNNVLLACGSADFCARIFNAQIPEVDAKSSTISSMGNAENTSALWTSQEFQFGDIIAEFCHDRTASGWVHSIAFSPFGDVLAWTTHDSTVCVTDARVNASQITSTLKMTCLPFRCIAFLDNDKIVGAGHGYSPFLISYVNQQLVFVASLESSGTEKAEKSVLSNAKTAMNMFKQMDSRAQTESDVQLTSIHQNTVTCIMPYEKVKSFVTKLSSSGLDGKVVVWDMSNLNVDELVRSARQMSVN